MTSVSAIINGYKRPANVDQIILSLLNQSHKLEHIYVWWNDPVSASLCKYGKHVETIVSSVNLGVWPRFSFALNCNTDFIVIFDDDTIPGLRWVENCVQHQHLGLLGTIGLIYQNRFRYMDHVRHGWANPNLSPTLVDIVGHSWFFRREWLSSYFRELRPCKGFDFFGEDMHFSYSLQKYLGVSTYVPPHPPGQYDLWGSLNGQLGTDEHAISMDPQAYTKWDIPFKYYLDKGFRLLCES